MRRALFLTVVLGLVELVTGQENTFSTSPHPNPRKHLVLAMPGFELSDPTNVSAHCLLTKSDRKTAGIPLAPLVGKFHGVSPLLAWSGSFGTGRFEITVRDDQHHEVLHRIVESPEYRLNPPEAAIFQAQHRYSWTVQLVPSNGHATVCSAGFQVLPERERKLVDGELASLSSDDPYLLRLVRAQVLANHRLWYDAIGAYTEIIRLYPERAEAYEKRGAIYAQIEVTRALGDADFARADALKSDISH